MDRIKKIFNSLSKTELRYLKNYLTAFHNKGKNKALELITVLEKKPDISQADIAKKLYGNPKSKAFIMLKKRLLEKMLETLSLSINFHNNPAFKGDPTAFGSIDLSKDIIYALILRRRGLESLSEELLEKCAKRAEELALPELRLQALIHLRNISSSKKKVTETYKQEISEALKKFETDIIGVGLFDEFRVLKGDTTSNTARLIEFLTSMTEQLAQQLSSCYSVRAHYYYLFLKVQLYRKQGDYLQGKEVSQALLDLVNTHPGLRSKKRLGNAYMRLASIEMSSFKFKEALDVSVYVMSIVHPKTRIFNTALLHRVFACIYLGKLQELQELLPYLDQIEMQRPNDSQSNIAQYLKSSVAYINGDCDKASQLLNQINELYADKDGWNMGLRIYEILMIIDKNQYDLATARIETLRKHVARYDIDLRTKLIYKYLNLLEKDSYDFNKQSPARQKLLTEIIHEDPWSAISHETVKFDVWLKAKVEKVAFYPLLVEELKNINHVSK